MDKNSKYSIKYINTSTGEVLWEDAMELGLENGYYTHIINKVSAILVIILPHKLTAILAQTNTNIYDTDQYIK